MKIYRTQIHNHLIECRLGDFGGEVVLVNGRVISEYPFAVFHRPSHHFDLVDDVGSEFHVEIHRRDMSKLGLGRYRMVVLVNGAERCRLEPTDSKHPLNSCSHCGYTLVGLEPERGEVRCPECGRHTVAATLG